MLDQLQSLQDKVDIRNDKHAVHRSYSLNDKTKLKINRTISDQNNKNTKYVKEQNFKNNASDVSNRTIAVKN